MSKEKKSATLDCIEKVRAYVENHGAPKNLRFDASIREVLSIANGMPTIDGLSLIFSYGKAKGYAQARLEMRRQNDHP